ncbi:hypothetical protein [Salipiger abyssi]|uniref:DUF4156 domain-containing protein n=1 Tax=Salipiger abyssi TaxID=1250539 RepID=A0A1P8UZS3_9RHOB|nr:hypothetical protein [Salipiger abyssi]APZ54893.1 hypothetical protein Ga0080574_TMP4559 [Salipiger abyssi]
MTNVTNRSKINRVLLLGCATLMLSLAACGKYSKANRFEYGGMVFPGSAKAVRGDRKSFVATAGPASASLDGAVAAARYQGIKYCIDYLGTSDIDWQVGPDTPPEQLMIESDKVTFRGSCTE